MTTITVTLDDAAIQAQVDTAVQNLLKPDNYHNPIKSEIERLFNYDGVLRDKVKIKVKEMAEAILVSPEWNDLFAKALAADMAKRQLDELKRRS